MSIIEVEHLTKDYGTGRGVFDVSFKIGKGEVFGFLGPNGAGKSTTIRHLLGFSKPDSGKTKILDKESFNHYYEILSKVGYIPGEIALPQGLTGKEFLKMIQDLQGIHNEKRLKEMIELFKLDDDTLKLETKHMSLGVKRKLAVVSAFMSDPDVFILDEPTSGLDPVMQNEFIKLIKEEKKRGKTILLSSHIFSEVDETCDRIAIIKDGHIVSEFIASELKHAKTKYYHVFFNTEDSFEAFIKENKDNLHVKLTGIDKEHLMASVETNDEFINEAVNLFSKYDIKEFINKHETLEDYFMKFYKENKDFKGAL